MTLDRLTLAAGFREIESRVVGRRIAKVRPHGTTALKLDLSSRDALFIDVSRSLVGLWLVGRSSGVPADSRDVAGPSRTAALLFKKQLEGSRIDGPSGLTARVQSLHTSQARVWLRPLARPAPRSSSMKK